MTVICHDETALAYAEDESISRPDSEVSIHKAKIAIIDDEPINIEVVKKYLENHGYQNFSTTTLGTEGLDLIRRQRPDVVLLDVMMPKVSGLEILEKVRAEDDLAFTPILILTASGDPETKQKALELGATDFLSKPLDVSELIPRVRNALVLKAHHDHLSRYAETLVREVEKRTRELKSSRLDVIYRLARAAEFRDNETGRHVMRVGLYAELIARTMKLDERLVGMIAHAAPLHDVGKIGVPDSILLKPGKLTPEEFEIMQSHARLGKRVFERLSATEYAMFRDHTSVGSEILGESDSPLLKMASRIAISHHERWDGSGYPLALAGEDIPIEGRITAVADVFDALSSKRPYKPAFPLEKCFKIMEEERGSHFDPVVLDAFFDCRKRIIEIQIEHADVD